MARCGTAKTAALTVLVYDTRQVTTIARTAAKVLRMLPEYFITTATMRPPATCQGRGYTTVRMLPVYFITTATMRPPATWIATSPHVLPWKPTIGPCARSAAASDCQTVSVCSGMVKRVSCTLRIQGRGIPLCGEGV